MIMAAACNQIQTTEEEKTVERTTVPVTVKVNGESATRSVASTSDEAKINSLQIFVFDNDDKIESYAKADAASLTLNVSFGQKIFIALVNCPDDFAKNVGTKADLLAQTSYLKDNGTANFEMIGIRSGTITAVQDIEITVKRLVSKVILEKVSTNFKAPYLAAKEFKITGIYLINAAASTNFGLTATTFDWMNQLKLDTSNSQATELIQKTGMNQTVTSAVPYTTATAFYSYPNPTDADNTGEAWAPRRTRLVVQATLDGEPLYYSVPLPVMKNNTIYKITELNITRKGTANPWESIKSADATFTLAVSAWDEGSSESVTI